MIERRLVAIAVMALYLGCSGAQERQSGEPSAGGSAAQQAPQPTPVPVRIIAFNDFHGHLEAPGGGGVQVGDERLEAGGVDAMAVHLARLREGREHTATVVAGDLIGASPLLSSLFHDEPTIEAMNRLGLDVLALGNHEFDEGLDELRRMKEGGCHPKDGCQGGDSFEGARFSFLAANVIDEASKRPIFPASQVRTFGPVRVGFVGLTLEGTPDVVSPAHVAGLQFRDEIETINEEVERLRVEGVETIVVLIHEGGSPTAEGDIDSCLGVSGPIRAIADGVSGAVDVIVTGHTHKAYNCRMGDKLVTSAQSYGQVLTTIDLRIDPRSGDVVEATATNHPVRRDVEPDAEMVAHLDRYRRLVAPLANRKVGQVAADISREPNEAGESLLGGLIADAQLAATKDPSAAIAHIAMMNPGGIRASLTHAQEAGEGDGTVTYQELHRVQPFGNSLVTMTLTGAQLVELLEQQWSDPDRPRMLQVSRDFTYAWDGSKPVGSRIVPGSVLYMDEPVVPDLPYRVTVNSYLAEGGDGFTVLREGTDRAGGPVDLDALIRYFLQNSPVESDALPRIRRADAVE